MEKEMIPFWNLEKKEINKIAYHLSDKYQEAIFIKRYCSAPRLSKEKTPYNCVDYFINETIVSIERSPDRLRKGKKPHYRIRIFGDGEKIISTKKILEDLL